MSNAKTFLKKGVSHTQAIQQAIDTGDAEVLIPCGSWSVRPIRLRSNLKLKLGVWCQILADPTYQWGPNDPLIFAQSCENLSIIGNLCSNISMAGTGKTDGEWRHAVCINTGEKILIDGLNIKEPGGDGVYIGYGCHSIVVRNVTVAKSWRNGISVTGATDVIIEKCSGDNCGVGNTAKCFIDIEPNEGQTVQNIQVLNCIAGDNRFGVPTIGFDIEVQTSQNGLITLNSCIADGQQYGFGVRGPNLGAWTDIFMDFCTARNCNSDGIFIGNKDVSAGTLLCRNSSFQGGLSSVYVLSEPGANIEHLGGATFENCQFPTTPKMRTYGPLPVEQIIGVA